MARKKTEETPMPATATPKAETKPVRLDLSTRAHRLLRLVAAQENKSMASFAKDSLEELLERRAKELGVKP